MKNSISRSPVERKLGTSTAFYPNQVIGRFGRVSRRAFDKTWLTTSVGLFLVFLLVTLAAALRPVSAAAGAVNITALGTPVTQDFDTLVNSGSATWTNDLTIPGWYHARTGTGTTIVANDGASNAGNLYSYGTGTNTDRALGSVGSGNAAAGSFFWGVRLSNQTGGTITSLLISYTGEQWRNSAAAAQTVAFSYLIGNNLGGSLTDFQAAGVNVTQLDFTSPITGGTASALNGNLAANRVAISFTITGLSLANGNEILLRWSDPDHSGSDHGLAIDDFSVTADGTGGGGAPSLSINDVTVTEGNAGTTTASFTVSLSSPAPVGGVTFDIATQDNTATVADNDYVMRSLTGQSILQGSQTYTFDVTVNGDTNNEPNETFFVNVTNVVGATLQDGQGLGTITNDDFNATPIHTIQGSGTTSPFAGQVVTTTGIVTGVKSNGFFIQAPDAEADANPNTSEGVFVFTSSTPPAPAVVGNSVAVMGTVQEFIPSQDLNSPPATEIAGSLMVTLLSTGNPLPTPVTLTAADTSPSGSIQQLEKFEGMRVHVNSLTAIAPTQGTVNEANATSVSNGIFYGVITGVARPFREPGLETPDPAPAGSPCCIPRFDANPERLRVDSDGLTGGVKLDVTTFVTVTNLTGPLDYAFRTYTILQDPPPAAQPGVSANISAIPVPVPDADEFTVGSFNMERFFDTTDDPTVQDVVLTATAFNNRLNKASLAIRNVMRTPDVIGIEEMENLTTLQMVATKINNDAVAAMQPNPNYQAYLVEGNDIGGIDVGFLVKAARVTVIDVTQFGKDTTYIDPNNGQPALLNDRPSLVLRAMITEPSSPQHGATPTFPITVIVNHLRSLSGVDDPADGNRVRTKRRAQAEYLANLIQSLQMADPSERIVSVGDYNAFQFNDGYGDSIGTIKGTPTPASEVVLASGDLVNPNLIDLLDTVPHDQQYSFSFDGNAQVLDHELVNSSLLPYFNRIAYARNNGDFPESFRNDPDRPERISDHDMAVAFFKFTPVPCSFTLSSTIHPFTAAGGDGSVTVTAGPACNWTATSNDGWIIINSAASATGNATITFEVKENMSDVPRTGTLTVAGQTFTVVQDGAAVACSYSISPMSQSFKTPGAGGGTINVTATGGCGWLATSNASWITITSGSSGVGNGTVNYTVAVNPGATRTSTITVAGQVFTIKQKGN
jgi:predicted extracellular nuclease